MIDFDGKGRTTVINDPGGEPRSAVWHPDSQSLTYTRYGDFPGFNEDGSLKFCSDDSAPVSYVVAPDADQDGDEIICYRFEDGCATDGGPLMGGDLEVYRTDVYTPRGEERRHTALISGPGNQMDADFSADGSMTAYSAQPTAGSSFVLSVADAAGCGATILDTSSIEGDIYEPRFSPNGSKIAFYARPQEWPNPDYDLEAWTIDVDGTNLQRLTFNNDEDYAPNWSPDGTKIMWDSGVQGRETWLMTASGSGKRRVFTGGIAPPGVENEGTYRKPSALMNTDDYDAARFRPQFLFDSDEHWRPLHVGRFVREEQPFGGPLHQLCDESGCETPFVTEGLDALRDFEGGGWIDIGDLGEFMETDPDPADYRSPRPACDGDFLRDCDTGDDSAVYYNVTSTIGYKYLDYWLFYRMNDFGTPLAPNPTNEGEHEGDWEGVTLGLGGTPDTFDFAAFAQHEGCASWADWAGPRREARWGADCAPEFECNTTASPRSPGVQRRFWCPQESNVFDAMGCVQPARRGSASVATPDRCGTWFGAGVVAAACSPRTLKRSLRTKRLGRKGTLRLRRSGQRSAGSAPGIAQVLGRPLDLGERLMVRGTASADTSLAVRALVGRTQLEGYFPKLRLRGQTAVVKVVGTKRAPRLVLLLPSGKRLVPVKVRAWSVTSRGYEPIPPAEAPAPEPPQRDRPKATPTPTPENRPPDGPGPSEVNPQESGE